MFEQQSVRSNGPKIRELLPLVIVFGTILGAYLIVRPPPDQTSVLESRGFKAEIENTLHTMNRHERFEMQGGWREFNVENTPSIASTIVDPNEYLYFTSFESESDLDDWQNINGNIQRSPARAYHGRRSLRVQTSSSAPTTLQFLHDYTFATNESADMFLFFYFQANIQTGYNAIHFTLDSEFNANERVTILTHNASVGGYVAAPGENVIHRPLAWRYWQGVFIEDIKSFSQYDLTYETMTVRDFNITSSTENVQLYYLDYFGVQLIPSDTVGVWYHGEDIVTDYYFEIGYKILISSASITNISSVSLRFVYEVAVQTSEIGELEFVTDIVELTNMTATPLGTPHGVFDMVLHGSYTTNPRRFPNRPMWGEQQEWRFNTNMRASADLVSGERSQADHDMDLDFFDLLWHVPIQL